MSKNNDEAERAAFDAWFNDFSLSVRMNGGYMNDAQMFAAWQARASLPVGVPDGIAEQHAKAMRLLREAHDWIIPKGNISVSIFERIGAFLDSAAPTVKAEQVQCKVCGDFGSDCDECGAKAPSLPAAVSADLTRVECPCCPYEYEADSYDAGFIAGSGMCQVCDAAMPPKDLPAAGSAGEVKALRAYDQPVRVAIKMLERTLSPTAMEIAAELRRCLGDAQDALSAQHPDDAAVDRFATAMKAKLARCREKGRHGWQTASAARLSSLLYHHMYKADPLDVANLAMMLHQNGQAIELPHEARKGGTQQSAPERVNVPDVERWSVGWGGGSEVVEEVHPQGDYVRWEDYEELRALLASHAQAPHSNGVEPSELREAVRRFRDGNDSHGRGEA